MQILDLDALKRYHDKIIAYINSKLSSSQSGFIPIGSIFWYTETTAPIGFLICDGSAISRMTYSDLFSVIGTTFGTGDGSTTFTLPDLRASFIRGAGTQGSYSATFSSKQNATRLYTSYENYISSVMGDNLDYGSNPLTTMTRSTGSNQKTAISGTVRPYNIALTPIIKY